MTNKFSETLQKIRQKKQPIALNTAQDFEARRQVSEDMANARREYAIKSYNSQVSASKIILNS